MKLHIFDTETTGLLKPNAVSVKEQPHIIEYYGCVIDEDFNMISEFETFIKPPVPISDEITRITKITNDMVANAPVFADVYDDLCDSYLGCNALVAHNASFDVSMLANELIRLDKLIHFPWPKNHICTVEKSYNIRGHRLSLEKLHIMAEGHGITGAHRAKTDVHALVRCFHWLTEEGHIDLSSYEN